MDQYLEKVLDIPSYAKLVLVISFDSICLSLCFLLAMWLKLDSFDFIYNKHIWTTHFIALPFCLGLFVALGVYRSVVRYLSSDILKNLVIGLLGYTAIMLVTSEMYSLQLPSGVPAIYFAVSIVSISTSRYLAHRIFSTRPKIKRQAVAVYGAGNAGRQLVTALKKGPHYKPILFIDDNELLDGRVVNGVKVQTFKNAIVSMNKYGIETLLLAMPSMTTTQKNAVTEQLRPLKLEIKTMPSLRDIIEGKTNFSQLRHIKIEELLERESIPPNDSLMEATIKNKNVMVTGAGGSIGSELCRQILKRKPKKLVLFDHSEFNLYKIEQEIKHSTKFIENAPLVIVKLGTIQHERTVSSLLFEHAIDTIYHAAAYKHVPLIEENAIEAVKNNVIGTYVLAKSATQAQVSHFILISTDKAVRPTNIMGATKRIAELICQSEAGLENGTTFSIVRFGNVLGSSGSVIPLFSQQIEKGGPLTVTHKEVTRYFMTIKEASQLVIQAASMSKGGEVFLLDMGEPIQILNVARRMASLQGLKTYIHGEESGDDGDIPIEITGLRPGEKLYEELLIGAKSFKTKHSRIMMTREKMASPHETEALVNDLKNACEAGSQEKIICILKTAPTDYSPN